MLKNYLLIFFLLFFSDDTLLFGTNSNQDFIIFKYIIYIFVVSIYFFQHKSLAISKSLFRSLKVFIILLLIIFFSSLYNNDFMTGNLLALLVLITAIIYSQIFNFSVFREYYIRAIYFLSISSLFIYIINIFLPSLLSFFPIIENYGEVSFRSILISNVFLLGNEFRNTGIFREPGVYSIYLNVAIIFILFANSKISSQKLIVIVLTLFTTMSTAGILVFFLIILLYFFIRRSFKNFFIAISIGFILISIFVYFPTLYENVFAKLNTNNKDYLSSLSRIASFLVPIEIIKESPIFGVGLTDFVKYYETLSTRVVGYTMKADSTSTNTFLNLFAIFGIIYGGIIIKYYYHFCKLVLNKSAFLLLIIIFIMFSSQDLRYSLLFLTLLSYGIIAKYNKRTQ